MQVFLNNVRISFPDLFVPKALEQGQTPKYGADFIITDDTQVLAVKADGTKVKTTMDKVLEAVANEAWDENGAKMLKALEPSKKCYRDGDTKMNRGGEIYDGYEGTHYVAAKNKARPTVIDRDRTPLTEDDGKPYSGCYVNVKIDVYAMTDMKRKGVFASLLGVQFVKDGDAFSGGAVAGADEFDDISDEELAEDEALV